MATMKTYRCDMFDKNNIKPDICLYVDADTKGAAINAAREILHAKAQENIAYITSGMGTHTLSYINNKGEQLKATVRQCSPAYINHLVDECWGFSSVMVVDGTSKGVSSEKAIENAARKLEDSQKDADSSLPASSPVKARKRRWTRAEKRAAKAARESKANLKAA